MNKKNTDSILLDTGFCSDRVETRYQSLSLNDGANSSVNTIGCHSDFKKRDA